jgi:hypothetical protein
MQLCNSLFQPELRSPLILFSIQGVEWLIKISALYLVASLLMGPDHSGQERQSKS